MKILLIAPTSYKYYQRITSVIQSKGDIVDYLPDFKPTFFNRIVRYLSYRLIVRIQNHYIVKNTGNCNRDYDIVFIIRGYAFQKKTIDILKKHFHKAKFVLYQWDPVSVSKFDLSSLDLFDKCFTFDCKDAAAYPEYFTYKPLFFIPTPFQSQAREINYDFSFIGATHSNRLSVISNFFDKNADKRFYIKFNCQRFKFYKGFLFQKELYLNAMRNGWISYSPIPWEQTQKVFEESNAIIDIHHPSQNGLSIRVLEVLSKGKKLITTNTNILKEPFYNKNMICVIDQNGAGFSEEFLSLPNVTLDISPYKIENWVDEIIYKR